MSALPDLPPVAGQHRNGALAAARKARAIELRTAGLTYEQIAAELGYANRGTVHRIIADALQGRVVSATDELRFLETARLDALQHAVWERALAGHLPSVRIVMRSVMARSQLLGLDRRHFNATRVNRPRTVVVAPND